MKKLFGLLALLAALGGTAHGQGQQGSAAGNPTNVSLTTADTGTCKSGSAALQQLPLNANTSTVTLAGTFTATITVSLSANGGFTWITQGTQTGVGTSTYNVAGFTFICADPTSYTSGIVNVTINSSLAGGGTGGGITWLTVATLPGSPALNTTDGVTDGNGLSCTTGGGSTKVLCRWNGASWDVVNARFANSPTVNGDYNCLFHVTASTAVDPTCPLTGEAGRAITGSTTTDPVVFSDNLTIITHDKAASGAVNETLPTATTLGNASFAYAYCNHSAQTDTITPTTWTIQAGSAVAGATLSVASGVCYRIHVDSNSATNWLADSTGSSGGANPGGAVGNLQYQVNATTFGGAARTVVLNSGANQIPATPVAGTTYILSDTSANYTQSAAITWSANNVTIGCTSHGVVIQFTGATDGFDITGNNGKLTGCTLDHNSQSASGTGPLANVSGAASDNIIEDNWLQNVGTTNPAASVILVTGTASRNHVRKNLFVGTLADAGIAVTATGTNTLVDNEIDNNQIPAFNPGAAGLHAIDGTQAAGASNLRLKITNNLVIGQGTGAMALISFVGPSNQTACQGLIASHNELRLTANSSGGGRMMHIFCFGKASIDHNIIDDNGFILSGAPLDGGDGGDSVIAGNIINASSGSENGIVCTDCSRNAFSDNAAKGIGGGLVGIFLSTAAGPSSDNTFTGNTVNLGFNGICYEVQANGASQPANDNTYTGNHCDGTDAASQFAYEVVNTTGGVTGTLFNGNSASHVTNGYVVGASVTSTAITNPFFDSVTAANRYSFSSSTSLFDILNGVLFANIPANLAQGSMLFVSDSTIANPCASGGTGAILKRLGGGTPVNICN